MRLFDNRARGSPRYKNELSLRYNPSAQRAAKIAPAPSFLLKAPGTFWLLVKWRKGGRCEVSDKAVVYNRDVAEPNLAKA